MEDKPKYIISVDPYTNEELDRCGDSQSNFKDTYSTIVASYSSEAIATIKEKIQNELVKAHFYIINSPQKDNLYIGIVDGKVKVLNKQFSILHDYRNIKND